MECTTTCEMDQKKLNYLLITSAKNGQLYEVKQALEQGANVNAQDEYNKMTSICWASCHGHTDTVQYLLEAKADHNIPDVYGSTPLITSVGNGHVDVIALLLKHGVNIHHTDERGETALHVSSAWGHKEVTELLLRHQTKINAVNEDGWTALHCAVYNNHPEIVKILISNGADITVVNKNGWTALHCAVYNNNPEIIKILISYGADITVVDKDGNTPLMLACQRGHLNVADLLLEQGANISVVNEDGWTALHYAVFNNHPDLTKVLITYGANITVVTKDGKTPLDLANGETIRHLTDEKLRQLFKKGLHKGNVYLSNIRLVLMGPPCVGKTSFKSLLFNWPVTKVHDSTGLATRPVRAIERVAERNEGNFWDRVTRHDLLKMLSDAIRALEQQSDDVNDATLANAATSTNFSLQSTSYVTGNSSKEIEVIQDNNSPSVVKENWSSSVDTEVHPILNSSTDMPPLTVPISSYVDVKSSQETTTISTVGLATVNTASLPFDITASSMPQFQQRVLSTDPDNYSNEMVKVLGEREISEDLHKATWINILDSGGQPQFADVSRAFIRGNTINIICTNLAEKLSDKPQFFYSLNGKILNQPSELQMTNMQLIEHFVRSVAASKSMAVVNGNQSLRPIFMIIGTYYDKTRFWPFYESLREKNAQILASLIEFRDSLVFYNESSEEVIFPVDNLCWFNREKISSSIRERIMSFQKDVSISAPIPVRWYMFELRVKEEASQNEHGMISLESCCAIGINLSITGEDVLNSITYLHSMALFLYFPVVLPNVIFTNPQYLLDMLSALIRVSFVDSLEDILPGGQSLEPETQRKFCEDGIFDSSLLNKLCLPFVSPLFSEEKFLKLLQYLCIIAPIFSADLLNEFFMPVVLPPHQMTEKHISVFKATCDPMIVDFETNVVPQGIFTALVVAIVSRQDKPQFFIDSRSPTFPRQLRYAVLLYSEDLFGSVLLVDRFYWLEVYYNGLNENCFHLRHIICEAISTCADILAYNKDAIIAQVSVPCQQNHLLTIHDNKLHPAVLSMDKDPPIIRCSIEKELPTLKLTDERQTCWLTGPANILKKASEKDVIPVSSTLPNGSLDECHLSTLVKLIKDVDDWEILGIHLGVKDSVIKDIKTLNYFQPAPSRKDMLVTWLKSGNANRPDFIESLKAIGELRIVQEILSQNDKATLMPVDGAQDNKLHFTM